MFVCTQQRVLRSPRTPWAHWLRVDETSVLDDGKAKNAPKGFVRAEIEGQDIHLHSMGVTRVTLALDRTLVDLKKTRSIEDGTIRSKCGWSPFEGVPLTGWPVATFVHGRAVYRDGELIESGPGQAIRFAD